MKVILILTKFSAPLRKTHSPGEKAGKRFKNFCACFPLYLCIKNRLTVKIRSNKYGSKRAVVTPTLIPV